jgi:hypothetical protein
MHNLLPAVSLSSFVHLYKAASPRPKEYSLPEKYLFNGNNIYPAITASNKVSTINHPSPAAIRVVAVSLQNITNETIILKKGLRLQEENRPGERVDFMPPALTKKQAVSVYFMYNLLLQRLPQAENLNCAANYKLLGIADKLNNAVTNPDIFTSSIQNLDVIARLKEANLFYKSLLPGQTLTGLLLCPTSSAAPLQFYLA